MRVLLTHAFCWPYVRRGTERNVDVWYRYLRRSGYDARILATRPPGSEPSADPNKLLLPQTWSPWMESLRLTPQHTFLWDAWNAIPRIESDVVHSFYFYDSLAASLRRGSGRKYGVVLQLNGVPIPGVSCRRFLPPEGLAMRRAVREADRCIVCSEFVREALREHLNGDAVVIPPPVDPETWPCGTGERADPPVILAVGNFNERRKGIRPLVKAFSLMRSEGRNVRLRVSGTVDAALREELTSSVPAAVAAHIQFLGLGRPEDLPMLYQSASVLALPAMWEPSG
ncbi:MAG TPA: glycosyltransferase family 4 protein, partial [Bryobacteraceae bacterium]